MHVSGESMASLTIDIDNKISASDESESGIAGVFLSTALNHGIIVKHQQKNLVL